MCSVNIVSSNQIADLANEDTPQLYVACGRGPRSSLRVLRHGLEVGHFTSSHLHTLTPSHPHTFTLHILTHILIWLHEVIQGCFCVAGDRDGSV